MSVQSKIEWTHATWNPIRGCTRVSPGCGGPGDQGGCYAERMAARFSKPSQWGHGYAEMRDGKPRWTGRVELIRDNLITPLRWGKPKKIFANSTSDLFHEALPDDEIACVYAYMCAAYWHTFQVLTKRPDRAQKLLSSDKFREMICSYLLMTVTDAGELGLYDPLARRTDDWRAQCPDPTETWPLVNVWHGTSAERQPEADERIPRVLETPAAIRFVSAEPLLGAVDLKQYLFWIQCQDCFRGRTRVSGHFFDEKCPVCAGTGTEKRGLDWVIVGGESGPRARHCHPDWVRSIRDACQAAGVPFFFKQWGEWAPGDAFGLISDGPIHDRHGKVRDWMHRYVVCEDRADRLRGHSFTEHATDLIYRVGKSRAGRLLDGRVWNEFPEVGR